MKKLHITSGLKTGLILLVGVVLASAFLVGPLPLAQAAPMTPAEMIQSQLPAGKTIVTATDAELLEAVCKAVKKWPKEAPLIVRTAYGARKTLRADILCMAIRCLRDKHSFDCLWVVDILREWIKEDPDNANELTELILKCSPECRDVLQNLAMSEGAGNFTNPPANVNAPPGSVGGGAGGNVCLVCHNGQEIQIACSDVADYLRSHPGDTAGACQVTPATNP